MEKTNVKDTRKGITLIALVITVIVMLILVAVTINMAINGGLFEFAGKAAKDTEEKRNNELEISKGGVTVGTTTYNSIDEYIESMKDSVKLIEFTVNGETYHAEEGMTWLDYFKSEYVKELLPEFNGEFRTGMNINTVENTTWVNMDSATVGLPKHISYILKNDKSYSNNLNDITQEDMLKFGDEITQGTNYYLWSGYVIV